MKYKSTDADKYGSNSNYFSLKNDRDSALVRFMYNTMEDVEGISVHQVEIDGKNRYVNCLREYNDPIDVCPFCKARMQTVSKIFVPLYDVDEGVCKIWERGKTFFSKLSGLCSRYNPLVATIFEIERNGKPGETTTRYETYVNETDETVLEDLPEPVEVLGSIVLDRSAEDMEYFLEHGIFEGETNEEPQRRNPTRDRTNDGPRNTTREAGTPRPRQNKF
jgi:hypothetical protein